MSVDNAPHFRNLGRTIRERRTGLGLTQQQLGERVGWSQERVSALENGRYGMPSLPSLVRLAGALEMPLDDLIAAAGYPVAPEIVSTGVDETADVAMRYALQRLLSLDSLSLKSALAEASDVIAQAMGADKVDAFMYEAETDTLVAVGASNTPMGRLQHELGLDREPITNGGRSAEAYRTGTSFYTPEADNDGGMLRGPVEALGIRSYLAVPLQVDGETIGVLCAASAQPNRYGESELQFFEAVAH